MIILEKNPYDVPIEELKNINIKSTILRGKEYTPKKTNILITILKGMLRKGIC